jgi:hypothetical protein
MTEVVASPSLAAIAAAIPAAIAIASAIVVTGRARVRAAAAERRLTTLYAEIATAIGSGIDCSTAGRSRDQVSAELKRVIAARAARPHRDEADDWVAIAVRALDTASRVVAALEAGNDTAHVATALGLSERVAASRETVASVVSARDLNDALMSGALNDVLTTAPLLAGYFSRDARLATVIEAYVLAAAALRLALAEANVLVETPAVLSIVSDREARGEAMDPRELRRIPQARTLANSIADRLAPGENLIVYCSVPGWTTQEKHRPAAVVLWNSASWLV